MGLSTHFIYRKKCEEKQKEIDYLYDKNAVYEMENKELTYKFKTRKDHLSEIKKTDYDVIIIGCNECEANFRRGKYGQWHCAGMCLTRLTMCAA